MPPEARLVAQIQKYIESQGGRSFKIVGDSEGLQEAGIPDLLVCYRGLFAGVEVKQPGAETNVSPRQQYVMRSIQLSGGYTAVVTSVQGVARLLRKMERKR